MDKVAKKLGDDIKTMYEEEVFNTLMAIAVPEIIDAIEEDYELLLNGRPAHRKSLTRPDLYQDLFMERLNNFEFVEVSNGHITLNVPDMESFDFSGELRVVQAELEGLAYATYLEIKETDRRKMGLPKALIRFRLYGLTLYLYNIKKHKDLEIKLKDNKVERVEYPFSRVGPIDLFARANEIVDEYMDSWLNGAIKEGQVKFTKKYKGKTL